MANGGVVKSVDMEGVPLYPRTSVINLADAQDDVMISREPTT